MNSDEFKILQLPTEVIVKIFSYVQMRDAIPLVCQRFYEVLCLMERNMHQINICDERIVRKLPSK